MASRKQAQAAKRNIKKATGGEAQQDDRRLAEGDAQRSLAEHRGGPQRVASPGHRLEDRTRTQLYARALNIPGRSSMGKDELIYALRRS